MDGWMEWGWWGLIDGDVDRINGFCRLKIKQNELNNSSLFTPSHSHL